jgi:hypothetical protein
LKVAEMGLVVPKEKMKFYLKCLAASESDKMSCNNALHYHFFRLEMQRDETASQL